MKILVLGGAGKMGCIAVQALANDSRVDEVILADLNMEQARVVAEYLESPKIVLKQVDIHDEEGFASALEGVDCCLNAFPHNPETIGTA